MTEIEFTKEELNIIDQVLSLKIGQYGNFERRYFSYNEIGRAGSINKKIDGFRVTAKDNLGEIIRLPNGEEFKELTAGNINFSTEEKVLIISLIKQNQYSIEQEEFVESVIKKLG